MALKKVAFICMFILGCILSVSQITAFAQENSMSDEYLLLKAVKDKDYGKVRTQLQKGANVNTREFADGETPLYIAATLKDSITATFLLNENASTDIPKISTGETPLMVAVRLRAKEFVDLLILQKADVDISDRTGETALYKAVKNNDRQMAQALLDANADWSIADNTGRTPLDIAKENRRLRSMIRILEEAGAEY
jgi:hypothetical protein